MSDSKDLKVFQNFSVKKIKKIDFQVLKLLKQKISKNGIKNFIGLFHKLKTIYIECQKLLKLIPLS